MRLSNDGLAELESGLRYIADSPPMEHGGFHPNAVETAKDALLVISEVRALRKCEEALADHVNDKTLDCSVCRAALAAVRALEDKP